MDTFRKWWMWIRENPLPGRVLIGLSSLLPIYHLRLFWRLYKRTTPAGCTNINLLCPKPKELQTLRSLSFCVTQTWLAMWCQLLHSNPRRVTWSACSPCRTSRSWIKSMLPTSTLMESLMLNLFSSSSRTSLSVPLRSLIMLWG